MICHYVLSVRVQLGVKVKMNLTENLGAATWLSNVHVCVLLFICTSNTHLHHVLSVFFLLLNFFNSNMVLSGIRSAQHLIMKTFLGVAFFRRS